MFRKVLWSMVLLIIGVYADDINVVRTAHERSWLPVSLNREFTTNDLGESVRGTTDGDLDGSSSKVLGSFPRRLMSNKFRSDLRSKPYQQSPPPRAVNQVRGLMATRMATGL